MRLVTEYDILIKARWLESKVNGLADTLSRFNKETIAKLYLYWQNSLASMLYLSLEYGPSIGNI